MGTRTSSKDRLQEEPLLQDDRREFNDDDDDDEGDDGFQGPSSDSHDKSLTVTNSSYDIGTVRGTLIILSLWGLIFCAAVNMSVMVTIQSAVAEDLNAFENANWFTSVYMITLSSFSPLAAKLAYIFSPRLCISVAAIFFAVGAIVTSQASSLKVLLLGRVFSGLGASGSMMTVFTFMVDLSSKKRRGLFIGMINTGFTSGIALGAVIAGALLPLIGWRSIFIYQTPISLVAGAGIFFSVPRQIKPADAPKSIPVLAKLTKLDFSGAFCLIVGFALLLSSLSTTKILWIPIAISPIFLATFVYIELYVASDPIISVSILRSRGTLFSCLAQFGTMITRWVVLFYGPVYAIAVKSLSPAVAGSLLLPTNFGMAIGSLVIGWLHIRRQGSFYAPTILSFCIFACTILLLSQISGSRTPVLVYMIAVLLNGLGAAGVVTYVPAHLLYLTDPVDHALSLGLLATSRVFAGSFASAIGGGIFVRVLQRQLQEGFRGAGLTKKEDLIRKLLGSPAMVQALKGQEKDIVVQSYVASLETLFLVAACVSFLMVAVQACVGRRSFQKRNSVMDEEGEAEEDIVPANGVLA